MYKLTDFSLKELRVLNDLVQKTMKSKQNEAWWIDQNIHHNGPFKKELMDRATINVPELRTWSVQIHNAIDIVKDRETTHAN